MLQVFAKSHIGYSHVKSHKPCQDHSTMYQSPNHKIITCCDGHGGDVYIRSKIGSNFASIALYTAFQEITPYFLSRYKGEEIEHKIKLSILCAWNKLVENFTKVQSFSKKEMISLTEDQVFELKRNPAKAYGTTLSGAMLIGNKLVVASIGDTECLLIKNGELEKVFNTDDDPAGNVTYSMCQEDAYNYMRVRVVDFKDYDAVILCTDGLSSPYQSYSNLLNSFIKPTIKRIIDHESLTFIDEFIEDIALNKGIGDDVSLAFIINDKAKSKYYTKE